MASYSSHFTAASKASEATHFLTSLAEAAEASWNFSRYFRSVRNYKKRHDGIDRKERPTPNGLELTPYDPEFEAQLQSAQKVMKKYRNTLRELAK